MNKLKMLAMMSLNIILSSSGCDKERNESSDDKLTLEKVAYNGNELRIDGYYQYYVYVDSEPYKVAPFFLYRNGVILECTLFGLDKILEMEEEFRNGSYAINAAKYKYDWGIFQINGTQIKYEKWVPTNGPFPAVTYEGVILNDTTFVITKYYRIKDIDKKAPTEVSWEYHFKQFSSKPDSTNRFIP
ncbi:MAG: hypothetical protein LBV74_04345 [Tannerella sp.]|jgi:hypothetical protein|nr:hypothetical protein [Tannerella sp.]